MLLDSEDRAAVSCTTRRSGREARLARTATGPLAADDHTVEEQLAPPDAPRFAAVESIGQAGARTGQSRHSAFARVTSPGNSAKNRSGLALHASAVGILARSQEHRPGRIGQPDESGGSRESFTWVMCQPGSRSSRWRMRAAQRIWQVDLL